MRRPRVAKKRCGLCRYNSNFECEFDIDKKQAIQEIFFAFKDPNLTACEKFERDLKKVAKYLKNWEKRNGKYISK